MMITFGDGAEEAFKGLVHHVPSGFTVALLGDQDDLPIGSDVALGVDVAIVATTPEGVAYRLLDSAAVPIGPIMIKPWEEIDRVHVY